MNVIQTAFPGVLLIERDRFHDNRGYFSIAYKRQDYERAGIIADFTLQNVSFSRHGVIRGLHFQHPAGQAKLVTVHSGEILDVCVDVREGSPTFGRWIAEPLSEENGRQLFIPVGFAHGFAVTGDHARVGYSVSGNWAPEYERTILWSDDRLGISWPIESPIVSAKDADALALDEARAAGMLPQWNA